MTDKILKLQSILLADSLIEISDNTRDYLIPLKPMMFFRIPNHDC